MKLSGTDGDIQREVEAILGLAEALDHVDAQTTNLQPSMENDAMDNIIPRTDNREAIARTASTIVDLARGRPMKQYDIDQGYKREHIIYHLACKLYTYAKKFHKESFTMKRP